MNHRADDKFFALRGQGFEGDVNAMTLAWLQASGAVSDALPDAWMEMLRAQLSLDLDDEAQRNDLWHALLGQLGYTGAGWAGIVARAWGSDSHEVWTEWTAQEA